MSSLLITIIQTNLHWEEKIANLKMLEEKINCIEKTQVVILPEMFTTGFSMQAQKLAEPMDGPTVQWMKRVAVRQKLIVAGSVIIEEDGHYYNRFIWMLPNGQYGVYDKRHLFAYAEEDKYYRAGNQRFIASVNGFKLNLLVCYDLRFPVWARQQFTENGSFEYEVLVYVANWPERRSNAWKTLLQARAIENQCYVVGVNRVGEDGKGHQYSGDSMIVDPTGEMLYHKAHEEDIFTFRLEKEKLNELREKFPFWRDADRFKILNVKGE